MIKRDAAEYITKLSQWFYVVSLTGPRQSGKSTLLRNIFSDYNYINLEHLQIRKEALEDPVGFIRNRPDHLIIDEAQYAPDLFSMIQVVADERATTGQYILSGSQDFLLSKRIGQSLAGRAGIATLLPLSFKEALSAHKLLTPEEFAYRGGYPRLYDIDIPVSTYFSSYMRTYLQRDISDYLDVRNVSTFRKFIQMCALRVGSLLNLTSLANSCEISFKTAQSWISMLEASGIIFLLRPFTENLSKRLVKTPKLYFSDTGLLCYLLNIRSVQELTVHSLHGVIFENLVIAERLKRYINLGEEPRLSFYRDDSKREIDLLDFTTKRSEAIEIKSSQTYNTSYARHLLKVGDQLGIPKDCRSVVLRIDHAYQANDINVVPLCNELTQ